MDKKEEKNSDIEEQYNVLAEEEQENGKKRRKLLIVILFLLIFFSAQGVTFAYFKNYSNMKNKMIFNIDLNGDGIPDLNIDIDGDNKCDINCDYNNDRKPDTNIDYFGDKLSHFAIDTDNDGKPDKNLINQDTNNDGKCDLNCDTDNDGWPDTNIDLDGDGKPDLGIDIDGDGKPDLNIDTDNDGKPDLNIDIDGDGKPDVNIDLDGDGKPDINIDINNDNKPDLNIDYKKDRIPHFNLDNNNDKKAEGNLKNQLLNNDYNKCYLNCDTDDDGWPDTNIDLDGTGTCQYVCVGPVVIPENSEEDELIFDIKPSDRDLVLYVSYVSGIEANKVLPGWRGKQKFVVSNRSNRAMIYNVKWIDVYNNFGYDDVLKCKISKNGIFEKTINAPRKDSYILEKIIIPGNTTYTYEIEYQFDDLNISQDKDQGKTFKANITVELAN